MIITIPVILVNEATNTSIVFLAIGLSLVADQITADQVMHLINVKRNYFAKERIVESLIIHILIAIVAVIIFNSF